MEPQGLQGETIGSERIRQALQLINDAAREKREELMGLLEEKYENIRGVFEDAAQGARSALSRGDRGFREAAARLEGDVRQNPWAFVGGVAAFSLLFGYILANAKKR